MAPGSVRRNGLVPVMMRHRVNRMAQRVGEERCPALRWRDLEVPAPP
jgi:hypothetical protein